MSLRTTPQAASVACWSCTHDVDDHDVRARCLDPACGCGWDAFGDAFAHGEALNG